jgi:ribosomal protein S18 acetylase RimI-like enzyme
MEIRLATLNDIESLCPLLTEFFAYNAELQPMYCIAAIESGEYPKNMIESDDSDFIIAIEVDALVGFIHINEMKTPPFNAVAPHNYAEIMAFMVTASHREQGIGSKLIAFAKQWSKDRNLDYIELMSLINAKEANHFYDRSNFNVVSNIRRYPL